MPTHEEKLLSLLERNPNRPVPMAVIEFELYPERKPPHPYRAVKAIAADLRSKIDERGLTIQAKSGAFTLMRLDYRPIVERKQPGLPDRFYPGAQRRAGR